MNEETIFAAALELSSGDRSAYLAKACGGDTAMRKRLEGLLAASDRAGNFMARPAVASAEPTNGATEIVDGESTPNDVTLTRDGPVPVSEDQVEATSFLTPSSRPDSLGRIGHYEVLQILGKGGFGIVYRAFDDVLQRVVAIKVMAPQLAATSPARKRFLREARTSAQVRHENVVQVYEVVEHPLPYLAMEFIPGETLQQRLDKTGPLEVSEVLRIGRQIAEGLAAAHATDLIHRDIKPSNVLIEGGPTQRVKITDFGLARAADDASISQSGIIAGTPMYMAPEQALGHKLDQRADIFSLGSVLYQMVAGRPPFRANNTVAVLKRVAEDTPRDIREIIPETPQWLCNIIAKLHEKKPEDRYQSAREIADVLADCEQQLKAHGTLKDFSRIPGGNPQPRRIGRKWKRAAAAVVLLLAVAVGAYAGPFALRYAFDAGKVTFLNADYPGDKMLVRRDGQIVATLDTTNSSAHLASGEYELEAVCAEGEEVSSVIAGTRRLFEGAPGRGADGPVLKLTIRRGDAIRVGFAVKDKVPPPSLPDGWVRLFNGKDLAGWRTHPDEEGSWEVKNGLLIGGPRPSQLFTEHAKYSNFHLRSEIMVNSGGDSGIRFRVPFAVNRVGPNSDRAGGYEAEFTKLQDASAPTGSVWRLNSSGPATILFQASEDSLTQPDEWCTYEVIADKNQIITRINGVDVANCVDPQNTFTRGHIALQCFRPQTVVQFRRIEIKELSPNAPAPLPPTFKNSIGMEFVKVPKGKSWLGGGKDKLGDQEVEIPADFYLGKYEVTQEEWEKVMGENPSAFSRTGRSKDWVKQFNDEEKKRFPVERVTWNDAQVFIKRVNEKVKDAGWEYRLPTQVEWEYGCRGGPMTGKAESAFDFYLDKPSNQLLPDQANYSLERTCKVGSYKPNRLGLFDMHGNVREWCADEVPADPKEPKGAARRVVRGGCWHDGSDGAKAASPSMLLFSTSVHYEIGLRLARVPSGALPPQVRTPPVPVVKQEPLPPTFKNGIGMEFVRVSKGKSWLGGGKDKLGDKELVIPADFYLGKYEVTQEEWEKVMGENPSHFSRIGEGKDAVKDIPDADLKRFPVENVSWDQCQIFIAKLNKLEKDSGWVYRLPKEAEWEYTCRGGPMADKLDSAFDFYFAKPTNTLLPEQANFLHGKDLNRTCKVGSYEPNSLLLYDMHGNVWEWCEDAEQGSDGLSHRVMRGGSWLFDSGHSRAAHRNTIPPSHRHDNVGLRLARVPSGAPSPEVNSPPTAVGPFTDADVKRIAALPAAEQVEEVRKELMRRNPGFDGKVEHKIDDGVVTEFRIVTDQVTDIAPIRVFTALRVLVCNGTHSDKSNGLLADLTPLEGMNLADLRHLDFNHTKVSDAGLAHFKDCKALTFLDLAETRVSDTGLFHFKDCKNLTVLYLYWMNVGDAGLAHFKDCKDLTRISLSGTKVSDTGLAHFKNCKNLTHLDFNHTKVSDAGLAHFKGMSLKSIWTDATAITDLTLLHGMPLEEIHLTPKNITRGLDLLREMKSLKTIAIDWKQSWPAAEFWARYDKGEFKE